MAQSKKFTLGQQDLLALGKGLAITLGGAFLTYLSAVIVEIDFGTSTPLVVTVFALLINTARKVLDGKVK